MSLLSALSCYDSDEEDAGSAKPQSLPSFELHDDDARRNLDYRPIPAPSASSANSDERQTGSCVGKRVSSGGDGTPVAKRGRVQGVTALVPPQLRSRPNVVTEDNRKR